MNVLPAPQSETWNAIPAVTYTLSEGEIKAASQFIITPATRPRICFAIASIFFFTNAGLQFFIGQGSHGRLIASLWFVVGLLYAFTASNFPMRLWWPQRLVRDYALRFSPDGIVLNELLFTIVPWRLVQAVHDVGGSFIIRSAKRSPIVIPTRIFSDDGITLWTRLEQQLIGTRMLQRRSDSLTIVNTASR